MLKSFCVVRSGVFEELLGLLLILLQAGMSREFFCIHCELSFMVSPGVRTHQAERRFVTFTLFFKVGTALFALTMSTKYTGCPLPALDADAPDSAMNGGRTFAPWPTLALARGPVHFLHHAFMKHSVRLGLFWLLPVVAAFTSLAQPAPARPPEARLEIPATDDGLPGAGPIRRYDWFRKLWAERRAIWAQRVEQDRHAFVFLGDSITQFWGDDMGGSFPGVKVANRGISGDTTRGVLIRMEGDVLALDPSGVVILIGTNDLEEDADPETIAANLKLILARLKAYNPKMPIILCQVFPSTASKKRPASSIKKVNQLYAAAVRGDPQVTLLETWPLFADPEGNAKLEEFPDLLHPNKVGYAKWAAAIHPILATLDFMDTEPDDFKPEPGFKSLFNGHDLTGWGYRPTAKEDVDYAKHWHEQEPLVANWPIVTKAVQFNGLVQSPDGRYVAKHGRLVATTPPEYRKVQQISTKREFPHDFVLKLEFRATPYTDSGIFIRGPQLQCRDYLIAGPYNHLQHYKAQDWNEIVITVHGRKALCTCNGEVLESAFDVPATGPIGLEGDRGQMEYRRIRIQELP
jgi:lysophospholipase L1-like esterase